MELSPEQIDEQIQELIPILRRRAGVFCKQREDADELFQETFLKIWSKRHQFTYNESLKAWCYKIMFNTFVDTFKDNKKRTYFSNEDEEGVFFFREESFPCLRDTNGAETSISLDDIYSSIQEVLTPVDQLIVTRILDGYKQAEVAAELKLERNNVKQHYFQAIRKVRASLMEKFQLPENFGNNENLIEIHKVYRRRKQNKEANHRKKFDQ